MNIIRNWPIIRTNAIKGSKKFCLKNGAWRRERKSKSSLTCNASHPRRCGIDKTRQRGLGHPRRPKCKKRAFKNTSLRCADGLGSSLTLEEAKLLANSYHGLIKDLPRGNNCKAKFKKPKIRCRSLTPIERSRERHLIIRLHLNNLS